MNFMDMTFEAKDLIFLSGSIITLVGVYHKFKNKLDNVEQQHIEDTAELIKKLEAHQNDSEKRENLLNQRINEVREDNRISYSKLESKIDIIFTNISSINASLSEISGYLKAKGGK